jgi:hypothetical protein
MALAPVDRQYAHAASSPLPAVQKTASQFSKAAQQASRAGETANRNAAGEKPSSKTNATKVQGRGERHQDQHKGDQHQEGTRTRIMNGVLVTTSGNQVTRRVNIGTNETKGTLTTTAPTSEPLRNLGQALPTAGNTLITPRMLGPRDARPSETAGKSSSDFGNSGTTSALNTDTAIRGQQNSSGSSGGGDDKQGQDDKGKDSTGGNQGAGDGNTNDIGGGGDLPPRGGPPAAGAAPDPDDFDASEWPNDKWSYFEALADRGIPEDVAMFIARNTNIGQDSVDHIADLFASLQRYMDDPSGIVAKAALCVHEENSSVLADFLEELVLFAGDCIFDGHSRQSTLASALSIVDAIVSMPRPSSGNNTNVANVLTLARFIVVNGVAPADVAACVGIESMNGGTAGFIASVVLQSETELGWHSMVPEEIINKVSAAADYLAAYDVSNLNSAEYNRVRQIVRNIISGSLDVTPLELPSGDESNMLRSELFQRWQAVGQLFRLSDEQADAVNTLLVGIELSQTNYDYDGSAPQFRHSLKAMASFLITGQERGHGLSPDDTLELIDTLLTSKRDLPGCEEIICNSAAFIMNYPYRVRNNSAEVKADFRAAFELITRHDILAGVDYLLGQVLSELRGNPDYTALDEDLLHSPERDAVMTYIMSTEGAPRRLADVVVTMMATGLPADEAALHFDAGLKAQRASRWAQATPSNTELSAFNQALQLEDALGILADDDVSLINTMAAPLDEFMRQGFSANQSFSCLERVLKSWNWDPLVQFLGPEFSRGSAAGEPLFELLSNQDRAFLSMQDSLSQFPADFIRRLAGDGLDPEAVADLLVGPGSENSLVPVAQKHTISILQAISGTLTPSKLQELVPYLNESRRPAMLLTAVAQSFLGGETQLAELELFLSDEDAQMRWALNANTRNSMAIETALCELFDIDDFPEVYIDLETAETTLITNKNDGNIELQGIEDWRAARNFSARLVLDSDTNNYIEFSCNKTFHVQFPGQEVSKPAEMLQEGYYGLRMLPPGTAIIMVSLDHNLTPKTTVFKLPPIRARAEE